MWNGIGRRRRTPARRSPLRWLLPVKECRENNPDKAAVQSRPDTFNGLSSGDIKVPQHPQLMGALGAALYAPEGASRME